VQQLHERCLDRLGMRDTAGLEHAGIGPAALLIDCMQDVVGDLLGDESETLETNSGDRN
jgi:hypothetical protein